jgi:uncharacterized protein YfdQ (DUF2303 family)
MCNDTRINNSLWGENIIKIYSYTKDKHNIKFIVCNNKVARIHYFVNNSIDSNSHNGKAENIIAIYKIKLCDNINEIVNNGGGKYGGI